MGAETAEGVTGEGIGLMNRERGKMWALLDLRFQGWRVGRVEVRVEVGRGTRSE